MILLQRTIYLLVFFLLLVQNFTFAQNVISGDVKVKEKSATNFGINILIKDPEGINTLSYGSTDENGNFSIKILSDQDSLLVVFRSLTTQEYQRRVANVTQNLSVELEVGTLELPEFTIKSVKNPVSLKNDTLTYDVDGFSNQNDRVISDVIKKLPGIEVLDNGMILYQGRGIQKFYIDGMDLLEGRYNLANENLPVDAVESIQILENHQPLRVLDSLVFSDRASLNLKLKRKNVWIGTVSGGLGASPLLYEGNFSPMTFREDLQMLFNLQSNISGKDISKELKVLTMEELQEKVAFQASFNPWFGIPSLWTPSIKQERFLFNQSQMVSANVLKRKQGGTDFRTNISYLHDTRRQQGNISTSYFLANDTIQINESHQNRLLNRELDAELSWIKNVKKSYLKNQFNLNFLNNNEIGTSRFKEVNWSQNANLPLISISNKFHTLKSIGKQLFNIKSDIAYRQAQQNFRVSPGSFESQLNDNANYERLMQGIDYQSFYANHSIGITKGLFKKMSYIGNVGLLYELEGMKSSVITAIGDNELVAPESFSNDAIFRQLRSYLNSQINFKHDDLVMQFKFPLSFVNINVSDVLQNQESRANRFIVEPELFMKYFLSGKWNTTLRLSRKNDFKGINDIHYGFILRDFRTFQQKSTSVPEVLSHTLNYGVNYRNPMNSIYASLNYSYVDTRFNTIMNSEVMTSGEVIYRTVDMNNRGVSHLTNLKISKYLPLIRTNMTISGNHQQRKIEQVINSVLSEVQYEIIGSGAELQVNPAKIANFSYKANLNFISSKVGEVNTGGIRQFNHVANMNMFLTENHTATIRWEQYDNRLSGNRDLTGFVDFIYQYKIKNSRWDISLHAQNILNNNIFGTFTADSFFIQQQIFQLRPRQAMFFLNFSF